VSSVSCPCGAAIAAVLAGGLSAEQAITAYELAAFQAMASGSEFYVRRHEAGHTPAEAADELDGILRRLRITLALQEKQVASHPPAQETPSMLAGDLRSWAHTYAQVAAHFYREAARLDVSVLGDQPHATSGTVPGGDL
jgi:hypothetical protein